MIFFHQRRGSSLDFNFFSRQYLDISSFGSLTVPTSSAETSSQKDARNLAFLDWGSTVYWVSLTTKLSAPTERISNSQVISLINHLIFGNFSVNRKCQPSLHQHYYFRHLYLHSNHCYYCWKNALWKLTNTLNNEVVVMLFTLHGLLTETGSLTYYIVQTEIIKSYYLWVT